MADGSRQMTFSPQRLLTPDDYVSFKALREASGGMNWPLRMVGSIAGRRYLLRVLLRAVGGPLSRIIHWVGRRMQAARFPLSPFSWLQRVWRLAYRMERRAAPLSDVQVARWQEAAESLHPDARPHVLRLEAFQAKLPHKWAGQYTAFGGIALAAGRDEIDLDLIRHEWAHYWWSHQMSREEQRAFVQAVAELAKQDNLPEQFEFAREIASAAFEGRDPLIEFRERKWRIPLQSNDGYRVAYCFDLIDLEIHAYIAQFSGGERERIPDALRRYYAGFLPD